MIRKIRFSNFYSFEGEQEISFLTTKKSDDFSFFGSKNTKKKEQITKIAGFASGNASGKTNVMRFLSFVSHFVRTQNKKDDNNDIPIKTFFNNKKESKFYIEFEKDKKIFYYSFSIKENFITEESLFIEDLKNNKSKKELFFEKKNDLKFWKKNKKYKIELKTNNILDAKKTVEDIKKKIFYFRPDISFVALLKKQIGAIEDIDIISDYFTNSISNILENGQMPDRIREKSAVISFYLANSKNLIKLNNFIKKFDVGLEQVIIEEKVIKKDHGIERNIKLRSVRANKKTIDWNYESLGTKSIFYLFAEISFVIENGGVLIADEIESNLHPRAQEKFIEYFINQNEKGNAQLIFSSHSLNFMNKLNNDQIFLVEKNKKSQSEVFRLDEFKIRTEENVLAKYMAGLYGGFPNIKI